jgi:hypothetical protein
MPQHGFIALAACGLCLTGLRAADATTPIDYSQRNTPYAPAETVTPEKQNPSTNQGLQEKRVETTTVEKKTAPQADRRARTEVKETKEKQVLEKDSHRPEKLEQPTSAYNHREAKVSTGADTSKPPTVAKYQDRLTAATATNMARFPAIEAATGAKINRFVFRKNPEVAGTAPGGAAVVPAAGGAAINK